MKAQGLVEYVVILLIVAVVLFVITSGLIQLLSNNVCSDPLSVECKIARVKECVATEQLTEDQCIILIGGGGK